MEDTCCDNYILNKDKKGGNVCKNCGRFQRYDHAIEYVDLHVNKYQINEK